jgi:hypothetical protein
MLDGDTSSVSIGSGDSQVIINVKQLKTVSWLRLREENSLRIE